MVICVWLENKYKKKKNILNNAISHIKQTRTTGTRRTGDGLKKQFD